MTHCDVGYPKKFLPCMIEATAEDPEPTNGSNTISLLLVSASTQRSANSTGNWHGCAVFSGWLAFTFGISQTNLSSSSLMSSQKSEGFLPKGFPLSSPLLAPLKDRFPGYFDGTLISSKLNV